MGTLSHKVEMSKTMLFVAMACALVAAASAGSAHSCYFDSELLKGAHSGEYYCPLMEHEGYTIERAAECSLCRGFEDGVWAMSNWYMMCHVNRMKQNGQLEVEEGETDIQAHREWYWEVVSGLHEAEFPKACPDLEAEDDHAPVAQTRTRGVPQRTRTRTSFAGAATAVAAAQTMLRGRSRSRSRSAEEQVPELDAVENALNELDY